jgi:ATP-dependent Clp protease protease subunit
MLDQVIPQNELIDNFLLSQRTFYLSGEIDEKNIDSAIRWMIYESYQEDDRPLNLYINSIGGSLNDAFALIDIMNKIKVPVRTIGLGSVMSSAFLIFLSGTVGHRYIGKYSSILSHQFSEEIYGKYHDLKTKIEESQKTNEKMIDLIKSKTNLTEKEIKAKLLPPTDIWLTSEEVIKMGIADRIF